MPIYRMTGLDGKTYQIEGPAGLDRAVIQAEILKRAPQAGRAPGQTAEIEAPALPQARGTLGTPPLKEPEGGAPMPWDYLMDRQGAIKRQREYDAYLQDKIQRQEVEDLKTQTGFFDRLGDFFSRGLLSARSGMKDFQAAIESDPVLKKQFQQEARRYAADAGVEIKGGTSWDEVKKDYFKVLPFLLEQGAQSIPEMIAGTNPISAIGVGYGAEQGREAREAAQLEGREDVTMGDIARTAPTALTVAALNQLGLEGILAAPAKTALGRVGKAALLEGGTESVQNLLQYVGPRVAAGAEIDPNELFENMAVGFVAGAGLGGGLRGTGEAVVGGAKKIADVREARRAELAAEEARTAGFSAMEGAVGAEFDRAFARYKAEGMSEQQAMQAAAADVQQFVAERKGAADVGTTDTGGTERGIPSVGGEVIAGGLAGDVEAATPGSVGATGVSTGEVAGREGPQQPALTVEEAATILTDKKVKKAERMDVARNILNQTILSNPYIDVNQIGQKEFNQAKQQLADGKHGGNPVAALEAVTGKTFALPEIEPAPSAELTAEVTAAPEVVAPPSIDEVATAPIAQALDQTVAPTPEAAVPTAADAAAQETGLAPSVEEKVKAPRKGFRIVEQEEADAQAEALLREDMARRAAEEVLPEAVPVEETVTEAAVEPAAEPIVEPTEESVAPVEEAAPTEEAVVEEDPYEDLANEVEGAFYGDPAEGIEPEIDERAYRLLSNAIASKRAAPEVIRAQFEKALARSAEEAAGMRYKGGESGVGVAATELAPEIEAITNSWRGNPNVSVVQSVTDLPDALQTSLANDGMLDARGFVAPNGEVFIVADNVGSKEDGVATLFHEGLGHVGLARLFRERLDKTLEAIYRTNAKLREDVNAWLQSNPDMYKGDPSPTARAVEEVLAERSEAGPIEAGILSRIASVIKEFARKVGFKKLSFSDAEVTAILARAHEMVTGKDTQTDAGRVMAPRYAKGVKQKREAKTVTRLKRKLADSHTAAQMNTTVGQLFLKSRSFKEAFSVLNSGWKSANTKRRRYALKFMYFNRDVIRNVKKYSPAVAARLSQANDGMQRLNGWRNSQMKPLSYSVRRWQKFNIKFGEGGKLLSNLINASTLEGVDPRAGSLAAVMAADPTLNELIAEKASNLRIDNRKQVIEFIYNMWEELGAKENGNGEGQKIYELAIGGFESALDNELRVMVSDVRRSGLSQKDADVVIKRMQEFHDKARKQSPYAPLYRQGDNWVRIGKGKNRRTFRYEGETAWNEGIARAIRELQEMGDTRSAEEIRSDSSVLTFGQDTEGLQADFFKNEPSDVLKEVFDKLDAGALTDVKSIKDLVFQMYVAALPKGTTMQRMQHRLGISGFSADTLRAYAESQVLSINRRAHLQFARGIRSSIGAAAALLEGSPNKLELMPYVKSMATRAADALAPEAKAGDQIATSVNKVTGFMLLTGIHSMIVEALQLPTFGLSVAIGEYGPKAMGTAIRYMLTMGNKFGTSKVDETGNIVTEWGAPSMGDSKYINEHEDPEMREALKYGWNDMAERGIADTTYSGEMFSQKQQPSDEYTSTGTKAARTAWNFITGGRHHIGRISREIMYMSVFEMEYNRRRKAGVSPQAARAIAADKAADLTLEGMFDYAQTSKPEAMRHPLGRVAFQYMTFPVHIVSILGRSFMDMVRLMPTARERAQAATTFFGLMGSTFMFAGVVGLPGFSLVMGLLEGIRDMMRDEDEPAEDEEGNPLGKINLELWFRERFLPEYFGPDNSLVQALGIDPATAQRAVEMGPISAATDINFGSSMGLNGLFFRDDAPAEIDKEGVRNLLYNGALGASGAVLDKAIDAWGYMREGEFQRAAEAVTPAFFRGSVVAKRLAEEGNLNIKGDVVKEREFYTTGKLLAQSIGFGNTEVAEIQKTNALARNMVKQIEADRGKWLDRLDVIYRRIDQNPTDANLAKLDSVWLEVDNWNARTGYLNPITVDNVYDSLQTRAEERNRSMQGLRVAEDYEPYVRDLLLNREQ